MEKQLRNNPPEENDDNQLGPGLPTLKWWWWLVLFGLLMWNILTLLPSLESSVDLPYSDFVAQVEAGNVASVTLAGSDITGTFTQPIMWPPDNAGTTDQNNTASPDTGSADSGGDKATGIIGQTGQDQPQSYEAFTTMFPETVGDPTLLSLLEQQNVEVNVTPPKTPWFTLLLTDGLPILLLVLVMANMGRLAMKGGASSLFSFGQSRARRYSGEHSDVTFEDVAGADEAKAELVEVVDFLRNPQKYYQIGAHIPRGVLLVGAPGTGKTLMAKAVAGEAGVPFFSLSASEFVEMFVGVGASRVRDLFTQAKSAAPAIVFIDELDAVGRRRGAGLGAVNDEREQTLNQLLVEMDGFDDRHEVIVVAATNRPDVLDPALLRPGRFDRQITVNMPDRAGREAILRIHTRDLLLDTSVDLGLLAQTTTGLSGADLANLCNESALTAARHNRTRVTMSDFEEALDRILLGGVRALLLEPQERRVVAYHEAGHALVAWLTPDADPVHKVTIIPRGHALGVTEQLPGEDHYNYSRSYLMARLAVMLGGRVSEQIALNDITTGAENDLIEATKLARRMVTRWGMGSLGPVAFQADEEQPFLGYEIAQGRDYGEETASRIDQDVHDLLTERYNYATNLLTTNRDLLDRLADTLLHEETIDQNTIEKLLGTRSTPAGPIQIPLAERP
jgi:cell division protease FtsH